MPELPSSPVGLVLYQVSFLSVLPLRLKELQSTCPQGLTVWLTRGKWCLWIHLSAFYLFGCNQGRHRRGGSQLPQQCSSPLCLPNSDYVFWTLISGSLDSDHSNSESVTVLTSSVKLPQDFLWIFWLWMLIHAKGHWIFGPCFLFIT